jgi:predicted ATPase
VAFALYASNVLHHFRQEGRAVREQAEAEVALAHEQKFPLWLAWGVLFQGWALTHEGSAEEGVAEVRHGLQMFRATGSGLLVPYCLALLAESYGKTGQPDAGLTALDEALALAAVSAERFYEAELYRLKGELLLQRDNFQEAEACVRKAIEIARTQQAKSLELRATVSLARLWQKQGKHQEAHQMLAEIYGWFTEGFDTKDLQEAQALLDELAEAR